jgi:hypothetical protein
MVMLWVNLATTFYFFPGWLRGRYVLSAIFGAIGGPIAYFSGAKLGAMTRLPEAGNLLVIGADRLNSRRGYSPPFPYSPICSMTSGARRQIKSITWPAAASYSEFEQRLLGSSSAASRMAI